MIKYFDAYQFWKDMEGDGHKLMPVVCVDLNGVLDQYAGWQGEVTFHPPAEGAAEFLAALHLEFKTIVVFTALMPVTEAIRWLKETGLDKNVDYVCNHKVPAVVYIDDRAVCHTGDFAQTLTNVKNFRPFWQGKLPLLA